MSVDYVSPFRSYKFLFERSATFAGVCEKHGFKATDYDIEENEKNVSHFMIDLFEEIDLAYKGKPSIFDDFTDRDCLFAFFPCYYFTSNAWLAARCDMANCSFDDLYKIDYNLNRVGTTMRLYRLLCELVYVCLDRNIPLVIENPWPNGHTFLRMAFPFKPAFVDFNRWEHGDYFKKPTAYWFFNLVRRDNVVFDAVCLKPLAKVSDCHGFDRSRLSPDYAEWFMKSFIWEQVEVDTLNERFAPKE